MKTPWRFVSDLVSRKTADKPQDASPPAVVDAKAPDNVPVHEERAEQTSFVEPTAVEIAANRLARDQVEAAPAIPSEPVSEAPEPAAVEVAAPATEVDSTYVDQEPVVAKQVSEFDDNIGGGQTAPVAATAEKPEPEPKAQNAAKRVKVPTPLAPQISVEAPAAPPKTLLEEMTDLDHEIATLRRQLSAKLAKQNAQMRALLDRYEKR